MKIIDINIRTGLVIRIFVCMYTVDHHVIRIHAIRPTFVVLVLLILQNVLPVKIKCKFLHNFS